jgi:Beta-propeller repeat
MKKKILLLFFLYLNFVNSQNTNYQRSWGTYFGDERLQLNDSKVDSQGNLYLVGTAFGIEVDQYFWQVYNMPNPYHNSYIGGNSDGFILKFNTYGECIWGTYIGGLGSDSIESIDIDVNDNVYLVGSTNSDSGIATANAYQPIKSQGYDFIVVRFLSNGVLDDLLWW